MDVFSIIEVSTTKPNIIFLNEKSVSKSMTDTKDNINQYIEMCEKYNQEIAKLGKNIADLYTDFIKNQIKWNEEYLNKFKYDENAQYLYLINSEKFRLLRNCNKIKQN